MGTGATDNILKILRVEEKEDVISNLLRYALKESKSFRSVFMSSVCELDASEYESVGAFTRVSVGKPGIPDLVIAAYREDSVDLIVIENKLKAEEGQDQTRNYASKTCIDRLKTILDLQGTVNPHLVFLTLFPDQIAKDPKFSSANYGQLHEGLKRFQPGESATADRLIADLDTLIAEFYACGQLAPSDIVLERLEQKRSLDGAYLYFRSFLQAVPLPDTLEIVFFFKDSASGRRFYGANISKNGWHPTECPDFTGFDPRMHFNIHFEPQYNVLSGTFSLYLHYEINPYETKERAQQKILASKLSEHEGLRTIFADRMRSAAIDGLQVGGGSNQVAKMELDLRGKNLRQSIELTARSLALATPVIDQIIREIIPRRLASRMST